MPLLRVFSSEIDRDTSIHLFYTANVISKKEYGVVLRLHKSRDSGTEIRKSGEAVETATDGKNAQQITNGNGQKPYWPLPYDAYLPSS